MISATDLAKYIINTSPRRMSNLELQKTIYFVELDYRKHNKGQHLINDKFKAWRYGPVVPKVYEEYRKYGPDLIERTDENIALEIETGVIDRSIDRCSNRKSWELVEESHRNDGAWQKSFDNGASLGDTIKQNLITEEAEKYGR
ncbi:MAG: SocA family protein [Helicobacter sp.]|nr:SocA family protein [Helicobacter sp.]